MATTLTKRLRTKVKAAVTAELGSRGWTLSREIPDVFVAPGSCVGSPLSVEWTLLIDSDTHGGAAVTGIGNLLCGEVGDVLMQLPGDALDSSMAEFDEPAWRHRVLSVLDAVSQGGLLSPRGDFHRWLVTDEGTLQTAVGEFSVMIDGPMTDWIHARHSPTEFLRNCAENASSRSPGLAFRSTALLALMNGCVDLARALVAEREPDPYDDTAPRIARFEQELAQRFPSYGGLQRE